MIEKEQFKKLVDEIMTHGFDEKTAAFYAGQIGDTPNFDDHNNIVVTDDAGNVLARLRLNFFGE